MLPSRLRRLPWAVAFSGLAVWIGSVTRQATVSPPRAEAVVRLHTQGPLSVSDPTIQAVQGPRRDLWTLVAAGPTATEAVERLRTEIERLQATAAPPRDPQGSDPAQADPRKALKWLEEELRKVLRGTDAPAPGRPKIQPADRSDRSVRDIAALDERLRQALPPGHPWLRRVQETLGSLQRLEPARRGLLRLEERLPPSHPEARRLRRELASLSPVPPPRQTPAADPSPITVRKALEKLLAEIDAQLKRPEPRGTEAKPPRPTLQVVSGPEPVDGEPRLPASAVPTAAALVFVSALFAPTGRGRVREPSDVPPGPWGEQVFSLSLLPTRAGAVSTVGRWVLAGLPWVLASFSTLA
ncbi:MAG: hypothetical protein GXP50_01450 [Deltaproteobacteria bacterium]|nr:hypothetical protein [Deltaproteobacteria bacterium]